MNDRLRPSAWLCVGRPLVLTIAFASGPAQAHVKWFAPYDTSEPPLPIGEVLTGQFVTFFLASILLIYAFFWVDRFVLRHGILQKRLVHLTAPVTEPVVFVLMRAAAAIFFAAVSLYGFSGAGFYLTPELRTDALWVPAVQLAICLSALHRRTAPLIGIGIGVLYAAAVARYGVFHLLDYLIILGVACYFAASGLSGPGWLMSRYIALYATTGLTLLWASIEKWGYPDWTYPLLASDPSLLMGLDPRTYMLLAGFVEFNLTFMLLSSASLLSRALALGLASVFILAIAKFGMIDAVGHLLIITILFVLAIYGPTKGRDFLVLGEKSLWVEAYFMTGLYVLAFVLVFIAYYGLQALIGGR